MCPCTHMHIILMKKIWWIYGGEGGGGSFCKGNDIAEWTVRIKSLFKLYIFKYIIYIFIYNSNKLYL